jgi:hypothetical protein
VAKTSGQNAHSAASLIPTGCCQGRAEQIDLYFLSGPAVSWLSLAS